MSEALQHRVWSNAVQCNVKQCHVIQCKSIHLCYTMQFHAHLLCSAVITLGITSVGACAASSDTNGRYSATSPTQLLPLKLLLLSFYSLLLSTTFFTVPTRIEEAQIVCFWHYFSEQYYWDLCLLGLFHFDPKDMGAKWTLLWEAVCARPPGAAAWYIIPKLPALYWVAL